MNEKGKKAQRKKKINSQRWKVFINAELREFKLLNVLAEALSILNWFTMKEAT